MIPNELAKRRLLAFALTVGLGLLGCRHESTPHSPAFTATQVDVTVHESVPGIAFKTAQVRSGESLPTPPVTARVTTVDRLTELVFSPLRGRVTEVRVRIGDHVKRGDRLVLVQTPELPELNKQRQEAQLAVSLKQATVDRLQQLVAVRAVPEHDLAVAQTELDTAKVDVQSAETKLRSLSVVTAGDSSYWLTAERNGTVVDVKVTPGAAVGPDIDHPACIVADLSEVLVIGDVPQSFANGLSPDLPATIRIPGQVGRVMAGVIQTVSGVVDAERQSVPVRVLMANQDGLLRPNAFIELELKPKSTKGILLVPTSAVVSDGVDTAVFIRVGDAKYRKRPVSVGRQNTEWTEISSGTEAGEEVVVSNPLLLMNALADS